MVYGNLGLSAQYKDILAQFPNTNSNRSIKFSSEGSAFAASEKKSYATEKTGFSVQNFQGLRKGLEAPTLQLNDS